YSLSTSGLFLAKLTATATHCTIESSELATADESKKGTIVASAFSSTKTLVRPLELSLVKSKDINATFAFEAATLLPYPLEKCIVDKVRISKDASQTKLQVFAALKEDISESLKQFHE